MRTEKEVRDKMEELQNEFFDNINSQQTLRGMKKSINILRWVLGNDWKVGKIPANMYKRNNINQHKREAKT